MFDVASLLHMDLLGEAESSDVLARAVFDARHVAVSLDCRYAAIGLRWRGDTTRGVR